MTNKEAVKILEKSRNYLLNWLRCTTEISMTLEVITALNMAIEALEKESDSNV